MENDLPTTSPRPTAFAPVASAWHTFIVLALLGALAFGGKLRAAHLRSILNPDRIAMYERTILLEWVMLGLVVVSVWLSGSSLLTILGDHWRSARQFFRDAGIGVLFLIASILVTSIFRPHRAVGDKVTQFLLPQSPIEMLLWIAVSISAGICEEAVFRGYLQKQFMALTKSVPAGIVLSALAFGAAHSYQGLERASVIAVLGAMAGMLAYWRRSVRPGMIGHALQDVLGGFVRH